MTFSNGVTASVRWGSLAHSDGYSTAEAAAFTRTDDFIDWVYVPGFQYNGDDVLSDLKTEDIALFLYNTSKMEITSGYGH